MANNALPELHLVPGWLDLLSEECYATSPDAETKLFLIKGSSRSLVWSISAMLGVNKLGIPGTACRLVERHMYTVVSEFIQEVGESADTHAFINNVMSELTLVVASCVQLATKMCCSSIPMSARLVRDQFQARGYTYTLSEITKYEFKVFRSLGFKISLWSSLDIAKMLMFHMNIPHEIIERIELVLNLAEYHRDEIDRQTRIISMISPSTSTRRRTIVRSLHLVAAAVLATVRMNSFSQWNDPSERLADLINVPKSFIQTIADIILNLIIKEKREKNGCPFFASSCCSCVGNSAYQQLFSME